MIERPETEENCDDLRLMLRVVVEHADSVEALLRDEIDRREAAEQALRASLAELTRLCIIDELTQIANRRRFDQYLDECWNRLQRHRHPMTLLLCDVDHFKLYNDTQGHPAGDRCLQRVAQAIARHAARAADLAARYGGEEFAVILPESEADAARVVAEHIRQAVEALDIPHPAAPAGRVTLSIGLASVAPERSQRPAGLVARADAALYRAKENGRNRVELG